MVDVCFEDSGVTERRPEGLLLTVNPAAKRAVAPSGRGKAAPVAALDLYDPTQEQFRAVVQGVYESLVIKELGVSVFKDARGARADTKALKAGKVAQEDLRALLSRAYAIATRQGQKHGYLEEGTQRPTKKGAALAAARYGASPKLVSRMLAGDPKAQKLAAAKTVAKLAENRQDYEITLQLVRKGQTPRVVEEIVGGKLVSFQQPGGKVTRRTNVRSWEERGMSRVVSDLPLRLMPLADVARQLGRAKGEKLRALATARRDEAKDSIARGISDNADAFQQDVVRKVADLLGYHAYDDSGRATPALKQAIGVLRNVYEDTATVVQKGGLLTNPVKQRTKGIAKAGEGYHWSGVRTGQKSDFTPVVLYATSPVKDTARGVGFFSITFPPGRRDVVRAIQEARGWVFDPTVSGTKFETGIATEAPKLHEVLRYQGGGAGAKRGVGGQFGKGLYTVGGPRVPKKKDPPLFERKADAEEYARVLDLKAVSFLVPQTHKIVQLSNGYYEVRGPRAEDEIARRVERNEKREKQDAPSGYENEDLLFETEGEAQKMAESLDYREARGGVLPITGYRTKPGLTGEKAAEAYRNLLVSLEHNAIRYVSDPSVMATLGQPTSSVKRHTWELGTKEEQAAAKKKRAAAVQDRINMLRAQGVTFGDAVVQAEREIPQYRGKFVVLSDAPTSAQQKRLAERSPERLLSSLVSRGEDVDALIPLVAEAEERGRKKLVNLIAKSYEKEATEAALKVAVKRLGTQKVSDVLSSEREKTKMRARMPGSFVQKMRAYGEQRRVGFDKEASDLEVLLAALYPDGKVPPTALPKYERSQILDLDEDALRKLAKSRLGLSDTEIEKVLTSVERSVLSKIVAEQGSVSGVGLIERGGFNVEVPKAVRLQAEAIERARRPAPKPMRPEALKEAAQKASVEERKAKIRAEMAEIAARISSREKQERKKNGAFSTGMRAARSGGALASRYGKQAYSLARTWVLSPAGQRFVGEVSGIAVALFGARAVSSGKLTKEQAALVQRELKRTTGLTADPARVAVALQIAGE